LSSAPQLFKLTHAPRGSPERMTLVTTIKECCFKYTSKVEIQPTVFLKVLETEYSNLGVMLAFQCLLSYYSHRVANQDAVQTMLNFFSPDHFDSWEYLQKIACVLTWEYFDRHGKLVPDDLNFIKDQSNIERERERTLDRDVMWSRISFDFFQDTPDATKEEWTALVTI
jgi:hypothetical protein